MLALAYAVLVLILRLLQGRCTQATALLHRLNVLGDHLTVGILAEALGLEYQRHVRAWTRACLL